MGEEEKKGCGVRVGDIEKVKKYVEKENGEFVLLCEFGY